MNTLELIFFGYVIIIQWRHSIGDEHPTFLDQHKDDGSKRWHSDGLSADERLDSTTSHLAAQTYNKKIQNERVVITSASLDIEKRKEPGKKNDIRKEEQPKENVPDHIQYMKNWFSFASQNNSKVNLTAQVGQKVDLPCNVGRSVDAQVSWIRRRDWNVLSSDIKVYSHDSRFSIIHDKKVNKWTLLVQNIRISDAGLYECQISSSIGLTSVFVDLDVQKPKAEIIGNRNYLVNFGSEVSLTCVVHNMKPYSVYWYHNNRMLKSITDGDITISTKSSKEVLSDGEKYPEDLELMRKYPDSSAISHLIISASNIPESGNFTCSVNDNVNDSVAIRIGEDDKTAAVQRINSAQKMSYCILDKLLCFIVAFSIR